MYAVVSSGGKQYRVEPGSTLTIERTAAEAGSTLTFDRVLLVGDGDEVTVGTPVVTGASVSATVLGEELGPKLVIFKFKQKVKYRRRTGHRQHLMRVRIDAISADGKTVTRPEPAAAKAASPKGRTTRKAAAKPAPSAAKAEVAEGKAETEPAAANAKEAAAPKRRASRAKPAAETQETETEPAAEKPTATRKAAPRRAAKPKAEE